MMLRIRSQPGWMLLIAAVGGIAALAGGYWDDAWHTDRGRDSLFAPPHLVIYVGVLVATAAVAALARRPWGAAQRLALAGGAAVLASAPMDEAWHVAFGRDAVTWSPPHMLAVVASLMLASGVLALATRTPGRAAVVAQLLAAVTVIGALQMPVLEFDSDVPQFPVWTYLPVAVAGWLLAAVIVRRLLAGRWSLLAAAAAYTAIRFGVVVLLAVLDHSGTVVPPVLLLAVLYELVERTSLPASGRLVVNAFGATFVWYGWLALVGAEATAVPVTALPAATGASVLAALAIAALASTRSLPLRPSLWWGATLLVATTGLAVAMAPEAQAHDPGQGDPGRDATLTVERIDDTALDVELVIEGGPCDDLVPERSVARRAGVTQIGTLESVGRCEYQGTVGADDSGRWFVYVELTDGTRAVERWAPLDHGEATTTVRRPLYEPPRRSFGNLQLLAGAGLYAVILVMLVVTLRSSARIGPSTARQST